MRIRVTTVGVLAAGMGVLMAGVCLQAQQAPQTASKEPDPLLRPGNLPPRSSAGEYQFHVQAGTVTITAEFMGHGVPTLEGGPYTTEDFVIVETALFGPPGAKLALSYQDFSMRINGKKIPVPSSPYLAVFKSLKDPEWEPTNADKDKGKTSVGTGGGQGGPGGGAPDLPAIVHMPIEMQRAMQQRVQKVSLAEGERPLPQAGLLFFEFHGDLKGLRSMELIYTGPAGKASMALQK